MTDKLLLGAHTCEGVRARIRRELDRQTLDRLADRIATLTDRIADARVEIAMATTIRDLDRHAGVLRDLCWQVTETAFRHNVLVGLGAPAGATFGSFDHPHLKILQADHARGGLLTRPFEEVG